MALVWPAAYRVAFGVLRDRGLAEDAAQEACAAIARSLPDLKQSDSFRGWAYRIVINRAISIGRKRRPEADLANVQAGSQEDAVTKLDLFRALDRLPLKQRAIVVLHYYVGLTSGEIAAACEMPSSSIRFHLMLARRALRHALAITESPTSKLNAKGVSHGL